MLTWLAEVLRAAGLPVVELEGWKTRTRGGIAPQGLVVHHTASSPNASNLAVRALLRDGRPDLPGPLSQLGLERDGTWVVVAAGRANHNGYGRWGNDSIGVEAYNDGQGEPWPPAQMASLRRGVTAICRRQGWSADRVLGHKETDPTRKIDPTFNMDVFRASLFPTEDDMTAAQEAKLDDLIRLLTITVHHLEGNDAALQRLGRKRTSLRVLISRALKR